jgi:hypothetical protein
MTSKYTQSIFIMGVGYLILKQAAKRLEAPPVGKEQPAGLEPNPVDLNPGPNPMDLDQKENPELSIDVPPDPWQCYQGEET